MIGVVSGYSVLYRVDRISLALVAIALIGCSLLWILVAPSTVVTTDKARKLRSPWFAFAIGIMLFLVGAFLYLPRSVDMATDSLWVAVENGYGDHFEESDVQGLSIVILMIVFGFPGVLVVATIGAACSAHFNLKGTGRYAFAFAVAMMPLVIGALPAIGYMWEAYRLSSGG